MLGLLIKENLERMSKEAFAAYFGLLSLNSPEGTKKIQGNPYSGYSATRPGIDLTPPYFKLEALPQCVNLTGRESFPSVF